MISNYNITSLMPNNTDPLIFFQDIKTEFAHILDTSRQHSLMDRPSENQDYIQSKADFVDGYVADLFNMIVARIRATQVYLNQPDTEPAPFEITRYKNDTTPTLNYNNLNNTCAINIGQFGVTSSHRYTESHTLYTYTHTYAQITGIQTSTQEQTSGVSSYQPHRKTPCFSYGDIRC